MKNNVKKIIATEFGEAKLNKNGYYEVETNDGVYNLHKLVYEKAYGKIRDGYTVHHRNGVKTDNNIKNLVALPHNVHKLIHTLYNNKNPRTQKMNTNKMIKITESIFKNLDKAEKMADELIARAEERDEKIDELLSEIIQLKEENAALKAEAENDRETAGELRVLVENIFNDIDSIDNEMDELRDETIDLTENVPNVFDIYNEAQINALGSDFLINQQTEIDKKIDIRLNNICTNFDRLKGEKGRLTMVANEITRRGKSLGMEI